MVRIFALLSRKSGMSVEAFRDYYEDKHAPLIMRLNPLKGYRRHYVETEPKMRNGEQIDFDVVTEMEFDSEAEAQAWFTAFASPQVLPLVEEDEKQFLDTSNLRVFKVVTKSS